MILKITLSLKLIAPILSILGIAINPVLDPQKFLLQRDEYGLGFQTCLEDMHFLRSQANELLPHTKASRLTW